MRERLNNLVDNDLSTRITVLRKFLLLDDTQHQSQ